MGTSKSVVGGETAVSANETCGTENLQWNTHPVCKHCLSLTCLGLQGLNQKVSQHVDQVCNSIDKNKVRTFTYHLGMVLHFLLFSINKIA